MSYAPPLPLPVAGSMAAVHPSIVGLDLSELGLLSSEEASSNQQLEFTVGFHLWTLSAAGLCRMLLFACNAHSFLKPSVSLSLMQQSLCESQCNRLTASPHMSPCLALQQWRPGGRGAHLVLGEFVMQRMPHFSANRAQTDVRSTSRLSPHLHHGEISTRHIYYVVRSRYVAVCWKAVAKPLRVRATLHSTLSKTMLEGQLWHVAGEAAGGGICCQWGEGGNQGGQLLVRGLPAADGLPGVLPLPVLPLPLHPRALAAGAPTRLPLEVESVPLQGPAPCSCCCVVLESQPWAAGTTLQPNYVCLFTTCGAATTVQILVHQ